MGSDKKRIISFGLCSADIARNIMFNFLQECSALCKKMAEQTSESATKKNQFYKFSGFFTSTALAFTNSKAMTSLPRK